MRTKDDTISGQVFLVLELVHDRSASKGSVAVVASIPGREGTLTRRWKAPYGILEHTQLDDLAATMTRQITDAVITWTGTQGTLSL